MIKVQSYLTNPILVPNKKNKWESEAVFNGSVIKDGEKYLMLYRAIGENKISTIGMAESKDKHNFTRHRQLIKPEYEWEKYGCEDPRVTKLGEIFYIFYTAVGGQPAGPGNIKVAVAKTRDWVTFEKHLVTPFNAKAMALFPKLVKGRMAAVLTANTDIPPAKIALAYFDKEEEIWSPDYWRRWYGKLEEEKIPLQRLTSDQLEVGAVPVETDEGWLLIYSHIQNYYAGSSRIFGVEALLLDKDNPKKILGRTRQPLMVPQEQYELEGLVPNVIFPTGAIAENGEVYIYYGAADNCCAMAKCNLAELVEDLKKKPGGTARLIRDPNNPLITPRSENNWENKATFNPAAIYLNGKYYIVYRAMGGDNTSVLGLAISRDGLTIDKRENQPIYSPREDFEKKLIPGGNSGCEDPRITRIGEKIYMCYTAYDGLNPPKIAITSINCSDFISKKWNWKKAVVISDPKEENKDGCLFPEKIKGKYVFCHRSGGKDIVVDCLDNLEFENHEYLNSQVCLLSGPGQWDNLKIGVAAPPIKTKEGWLLLYHGVSRTDGQYRIGAMLLQRDNPEIVLGISRFPLLEPEADWEKTGIVPNVVFPCGAIVKENKLLVYYGGADKMIGAATGEMSEIVAELLAE